jgi:hypothetical protein
MIAPRREERGGSQRRSARTQAGAIGTMRDWLATIGCLWFAIMTDVATSAIAQVIQLAVAPVFLLAAIGSLLNVFAGRLARVVDRARHLERHVPAAAEEERAAALRELEILERRMSISHWAIGLCTTAALLICLVVMILFVSDLVALRFSIPVSLLFIGAMASLTLGLLLFLAEVTLATRFVHVSEEFVARRRSRRRNKER